MTTFILVTLLILTGILMIIGFKNEEGANGSKRLGRLLIACGFGALVVAGFVAYGIDDQRGAFGIGIAGLLGIVYLVRGLRTNRKSV